jgi:hypothetical protein
MIEEEPATRVNVVLNWFEEMKQRVARDDPRVELRERDNRRVRCMRRARAGTGR